MTTTAALILALAMTQAQTTPANDSPGDTRIARWHADRQAAFIMYFDDGEQSHLDNAIPNLVERGLVGTFYLCPSAKWYDASREAWEKKVPALGMEYACHTMTHSGAADYEEADREIGRCADYIRQINPPSKTSPLLSYAKPGGLKPGRWEITDEQHAELMAKHNVVLRPRREGNAAGVQIKTSDEMFALVEAALAEQAAGCIMFHGVGGDWLSTDLKEFEAFLDKLAAVTDRVWVAGHMPIHKYAVERDASRIEIRHAGQDCIRLKLECQADAKLYDQPLTLITKVPSAWTTCHVIQGQTTSIVTARDGYVQYEAIPFGDFIVIQPQMSLTQPAEARSARAAALAAMLSDEPIKLAPPIDRRDAWEPLAASKSWQELLARARKAAAGPAPKLTEEMYLSFTRTGDRAVWDRAIWESRRYFVDLVLAECLTDSGEFLPAIREAIKSICGEPTWVMSAHDKHLKNYRGQAIEIDLMAAATASELATAINLLGSRLDDGTVRMIRSEIDRRVWRPFEDMIAGKTEAIWWLTTTNNWNAVCFAGVVSSVLTLEPSRQRRAEFLAVTETYLPSFLDGFGGDGYCSEGIGYWSYGFGHYMMLSDVAYRATGGGLDLLADARAQRAALYPQRLNLAGETYPAFADCRMGAKPLPEHVAYIAARMGAGEPGGVRAAAPMPRLLETAVYCFDNASRQQVKAAVDRGEFVHPLRGWFEEAGVLVCRPAAAGPEALAVAIKGGHNGEHHNHNDVGSYTIALGGVPVLADPGTEVYTARTFSDRRYESKLLNSFGHPVPVVAGQLQETGEDAHAVVLSKSFTDAQDELVLDMKGAYEVEGLEQLIRTMRYSRDGGGRVVVADEVKYASPAAFETAVVTYGQWKRLDDGSLLVTEQDRSVRVAIDAGAAAYEIVSGALDEETHNGRKATRLGIRLSEPVASARIELTITPAGDAAP